jgi:type II secretory ATPase GspE/PulE/Tfp pilus assembly ATPase PilB-like protein
MDVHASSASQSSSEPAGTAPQVLHQLVQRAEAAGASDLHVDAQGRTARVAFRLDGLLTPAEPVPGDIGERLMGRIKYLARLKTYQDTLPQDGRIERDRIGSQSDIRVSTYPTVGGEKAVLRFFQTRRARDLDELGFSPDALSRLKSFLGQSAGMLLLTGPSGSGKTTTIYACLQHLAAQGARHVITIEDPAEQLIPGVMQTEVNEDAGLTFAVAARHLLRQDPQVLVIGEIRDADTTAIAVRAALTGHLVIATLHARSCTGVFDRLLTLCAERATVAACVDLVFHQRLLRRLCSSCAGSGCTACLGTGYRGRVPAVEWLAVTDAVRAQVRDNALSQIVPADDLVSAARRLVQDGVTNQAEFDRVITP